jgi:Uma2 family endonuclease
MPEVRDAIEEVVNGEIRIMPPDKWDHALIVLRLRRALEAGLEPSKTLVVDTIFGLITRKHPFTSGAPDIAVLETGSVVDEDRYMHSAPQLIAEGVSPGNTRKELEGKLGTAPAWVSPRSGSFPRSLAKTASSSAPKLC